MLDLGLFTSLHSLLDPTGMRRDYILYRTYEVANAVMQRIDPYNSISAI